jgi:acetyltransferase-like isoleucine patch superfamily enzyme
MRPRRFGRLWIHGGGTVQCGEGVVLDARRAPIELHVGRGAVLMLGRNVRIEGGTSIEAMERVELEEGAVIGAWSKILDNHFHPVEGDRDHRPTSAPVRIGAGVVVGERCIVLPGTRIEDGARLGPGVVIGRRVPANATLAGSPPRRVAGGRT